MGKTDTLALSVRAPSAAPVHTVATATGGQVTLGGGNVTVQVK